jgi:hypothetical protein
MASNVGVAACTDVRAGLRPGGQMMCGSKSSGAPVVTSGLLPEHRQPAPGCGGKAWMDRERVSVGLDVSPSARRS